MNKRGHSGGVLKIEPLRLSAWQVSQELGVTVNKVKTGLKQHSIAPGQDGKFSFKEIWTALTDADAMETKAKHARYERMIAEARVAQDKVEENKKTLLKKSEVETFLKDFQTQLIQFIRHGKLNKTQEQQLRQIAELKFE